MSNGTLLWLIVFAISALCFFIIAVVVTFRGFSDLRELLRHSKHEEPNVEKTLER